jgi:hypothetical protein
VTFSDVGSTPTASTIFSEIPTLSLLKGRDIYSLLYSKYYRRAIPNPLCRGLLSRVRTSSIARAIKIYSIPAIFFRSILPAKATTAAWRFSVLSHAGPPLYATI